MTIPKQVQSILLADDDADDRFFFQKAVKDMPRPPKVEVVDNGEKLMQRLLAVTELPDLVIIDLNMPRKNGIECLEEIKNNELLKHLTVVMWSTSLRDETANQLYKLGAYYYMHKCDYILLTQNLILLMDLLSHNAGQPPKSKFIIGSKDIIS